MPSHWKSRLHMQCVLILVYMFQLFNNNITCLSKEFRITTTSFVWLEWSFNLLVIMFGLSDRNDLHSMSSFLESSQHLNCAIYPWCIESLLSLEVLFLSKSKLRPNYTFHNITFWDILCKRQSIWVYKCKHQFCRFLIFRHFKFSTPQ